MTLLGRLQVGHLLTASAQKTPGFGPLISATQLSNSTPFNSTLFRKGFGTDPEGSPIDMCKRGATDPPASYRTQKIGKIVKLSRLCQTFGLLQPLFMIYVTFLVDFKEVCLV